MSKYDGNYIEMLPDEQFHNCKYCGKSISETEILYDEDLNIYYCAGSECELENENAKKDF